MAQVTVTFLDIDHYTDAAPPRSVEREHVLHELDAMLQAFGRRYVPATDKLTIEVLDIDLGGPAVPRHPHTYDLRTMRLIASPRIKLRCTLLTPEAPTTTFEDTLSAKSYLALPIGSFSGEQLPYERAMLEPWFRARLGQQQALRN
jgi:hypothetical protein